MSCSLQCKLCNVGWYCPASHAWGGPTLWAPLSTTSHPVCSMKVCCDPCGGCCLSKKVPWLPGHLTPQIITKWPATLLAPAHRYAAPTPAQLRVVAPRRKVVSPKSSVPPHHATGPWTRRVDRLHDHGSLEKSNEVTHIDLQIFGVGEGLMSVMYRLTVQYASPPGNGLKTTFVMKFSPPEVRPPRSARARDAATLGHRALLLRLLVLRSPPCPAHPALRPYLP